MVELRGLGAINADFRTLGVRLVAITVDSPGLARRVSDRLGLDFPILSDDGGRATRDPANRRIASALTPMWMAD